MDLDKQLNKENVFRNRFHKRGLSNKSKSIPSTDANQLASLQLSTSHKHRAALTDFSAQNIDTSSTSQSTDSSSSRNICTQPEQDFRPIEERLDQSYVSTPIHDIVGTPTISLRKGLLDRKRAPSHSRQQDLSPNLQSLRSNQRFERVKSAVETQLDSSVLGTSFTLQTDRGSPGLTLLRQTPGKPLREKQQTLVDKHNETRCHADKLHVGGGISLWPDMENMRLNRREFLSLTLISGVLVTVMSYAFNAIHGATLLTLIELRSEVVEFKSRHAINITSSHLLSLTCLQWHKNFDDLIEKIQRSFVISADDNSAYAFYVCSLLYVFGIGVLLYYLADNVVSHSKLSPNRIKKWVCLLIVIGVWTVNAARLFAAAMLLEQAVEENIHWLNEQQKLMVYKTLDTQTYSHVLNYWTTKYLPPSSVGILSLLGVIQFNCLVHYMQYYSLPIITALLTPIVKLILSVLHVYGLIEQNTQA